MSSFELISLDTGNKVLRAPRKEDEGILQGGSKVYGDQPVIGSVTNLQALRDAKYQRMKDGDVIYSKSHAAAGDGGEGNFRLVTGAPPGTYVDDNGTIIVPTGGDGSEAWLRVFDNSMYSLYLPSGTGAVERTTQTKIRQISVDVRDFGDIGDSVNGDDVVFQKAMDYIFNVATDTGVFGSIFWKGSVYLKSPKIFGKNVGLMGDGRSFKSQIVPMASFVGSYLFGIDGDQCIGGFAFRLRFKGFTVNCSLVTKAILPKTFYINKAYDVGIEIWVYEAVGVAFEIGASNLITFQDPCIYGANNSSTVTDHGIRVLSAGSGGGGGGVKIINPDIENFNTGISATSNARVEVINPYLERNITGWRADTSTAGTFLVVGGQIESPGASGTAANLSGHNCTVVGGYYAANGGNGLFIDPASRPANAQLIGVSGDITDSRNYAIKTAPGQTGWYPSGVARNYKTPADAAVTTFFTIAVPAVVAHFGVCEVTVNARDLSGYSLWTGKYRFAFSNADGTVRATDVVEFAKTNLNSSANYGLAITVAATIVGAAVAVQITGDTSGALGAGTAPRIAAEAQMVQWDSAGAVYITTN